jgi:hypothetical protein
VPLWHILFCGHTVCPQKDPQKASRV